VDLSKKEGGGKVDAPEEGRKRVSRGSKKITGRRPGKFSFREKGERTQGA